MERGDTVEAARANVLTGGVHQRVVDADCQAVDMPVGKGGGISGGAAKGAHEGPHLMRRPALLSTPPSIAIADEPLGDGGAFASAEPALAGHGFEIVPAWQARPPRRLRRPSATAPLIAAAAAAALWIGRGDDARALRERPAAAVASETARGQAVVVGAAPARRAGSGTAGR